MANIAPLKTLSKKPIKPYTKAPDLYNKKKAIINLKKDTLSNCTNYTFFSL